MGVYAGPEIVGDGLVLALDAGNTQSYPGSGTTWRDLSGRGNTGTLTNGPTYSSANGGSIVFDGTNSYVEVASSTSFQYGSGNFTIELWAYFNTVSGTQLLIDPRNGNVNAITSTIYLSGGIIRYYVGGVDRIVGTSLSPNVWYHIYASREGTATKLFVNLTQVGSTYTDSNNYITCPIRIGRSTTTTSTFNGRMSSLRIYKGKALTAAEVSQNFNALRGRFGI
jgi:hypothetical protein